jgi:tetratricopeptide (TPR) repeat protein
MILRIIIGVVVILFIAAAVLVVIPSKDEVRFFTREGLETSKQTLEGFGRDALTRAERQSRLASELSERFNAKTAFLGTVGESLNKPRLENFLKSDIQIKYQSELIDLKLGLDPVSLIQASIDKFLSRNAAYVIFENFRTVPSGNEPEPRYEVNVNIFHREAMLIGQDQPADRRRVLREMSQLFARGIFEHGANCTTRICVADLPVEEQDLIVLTRSLDALKYRANAGLCERIQAEAECRKVVRNTLAELEQRIPDSTMPSFTRFLLEVSSLKDLISGNGSSDAIASALEGIHSRLVNARSKSAFVRQITSDDDSLKKFLELNDLQQLKLSVAFLNSYEFFLKGRSAYQSGQPKDAVDYYAQVRDIPAWFASYHQAYSNFAKLTANPDDLELLRKVINSYSEMKAGFPSQLYPAFIGVTATRAVKFFKERLREDEVRQLESLAIESLSQAINLAPTPEDELGARAERAYAYLIFGDAMHAQSDIQTVEDKLRAQPAAEAYRMVYMSTAEYFAAQGNIEKMLDYLARGVRAYPRNLCAILASAEYAHIRALPDFDKWRTDMKTELPGLTCT